jgi:hypothetical protein
VETDFNQKNYLMMTCSDLRMEHTRRLFVPISFAKFHIRIIVIKLNELNSPKLVLTIAPSRDQYRVLSVVLLLLNLKERVELQNGLAERRASLGEG